MKKSEAIPYILQNLDLNLVRKFLEARSEVLPTTAEELKDLSRIELQKLTDIIEFEKKF